MESISKSSDNFNQFLIEQGTSYYFFFSFYKLSNYYIDYKTTRK